MLNPGRPPHDDLPARTQAAKLAPSDKAVRLSLKSLRVKEKELSAARRDLWGGVLRGGASTSKAPGREQLEKAAARARGDVKAREQGGSGGKRGGHGRGDWTFVLVGVVGAIFFAAAGMLAAKYGNLSRPT